MGWISPWALWDKVSQTYKIFDTNTPAWTFPSLSGTVTLETVTDKHVTFVSRDTMDYNDTSNKTLFTLPANAVIVDVICHVTVLFNGSGNDNLNIGTTTGDPDEFVDNLDCSSAGVNRCGDNADMPVAARGTVGASAITVLGKYVDQNSNASAGTVTIEILWTIA